MSKWPEPVVYDRSGGMGWSGHRPCNYSGTYLCKEEWEALEALAEAAEDFMASRIDDMGQLRSAINALDAGRKDRT